MCIYIYIYMCCFPLPPVLLGEASLELSISACLGSADFPILTPDLPTNIIPAKIAWLKSSWKSPMDMRTPPLQIKILLESNPLRSRILVRRLAVPRSQVAHVWSGPSDSPRIRNLLGWLRLGWLKLP